MNLSPIVLFVYNRPEHTKKTLEALKANDLASDSELFIYSDASKDANSIDKVNEVRSLIKNINGFKNVVVVEQKQNKGLADSIISGVTEIVNKYGKIIVLEDDLVTSPDFLTFMNDALNYYENEEKVWHISGWNYPISSEGLDDSFLWRVMNCWGWGTWAESWKCFDKNTKQLIQDFSKSDIYKFNLDGVENFWKQVLSNETGKINTWAIYWYATIFKNNGLCLNPSQTYVENIGLDGSGEHCGTSYAFKSQLNHNKKRDVVFQVSENKLALLRIKIFYKNLYPPFFFRVINKLIRIVLKKSFK